MKVIRKRITWILLTLFLLPVPMFGIWFKRQVRQNNLDHALIMAIKKQETQKAIALLDEGANANTTNKPYQPLTLQSMLKDFWMKMRENKPKEERVFYPPALLLPYYSNPQLANHINSSKSVQPSLSPADNPDLVRALLDHGANPCSLYDDVRMDRFVSNADDIAEDKRRYRTDGIWGESILHIACMNDHYKTVQVLLEYHVNPDLRDSYGRTPLIYSDCDCARLLVKYGADVNARSEGSTPLMWAQSSMMRRLHFEHKAKIYDTMDHEGNTSVGFEHFGEMGKSRFLLEQGAIVSLKDKYDGTALDYARDNKQTTVIPLLEAALKKAQHEGTSH